MGIHGEAVQTTGVIRSSGSTVQEPVGDGLHFYLSAPAWCGLMSQGRQGPATTSRAVLRRKHSLDRSQGRALVSGECNELVEDLGPLARRRAAITRSDPLDQLPVCCHAESPCHVVMLPPAGPSGGVADYVRQQVRGWAPVLIVSDTTDGPCPREQHSPDFVLRLR